MKKQYAVLATLLVASLVFPTMLGAAGPDTLPGQGWWTGQQIQNIGTGNATIVSTAYDSTNPGTTYMAQAGPIAPGASANFLPDSFTGMPNGFQGSAVVSSDQPIKAIVSLTNRLVGNYGIAGGLAGGQYQGVDGSLASTTIRFPIVKQAFGGGSNIKSSTLFVQNAGSTAAAIHIAYVCGNGNTYNYTTPGNISPGQMVVLTPSAGGDPVPSGQLCSGSADSTQPIAGVATEHYNSETIATLVQATRAFTSADADDIVYAPIFKKAFPTSPDRSRTTGAQVQNVGLSAITVTATYVGSGGACANQTYTETSTSITPGASYTFLNPGAMPSGCLASAKFEASSGGTIVGIVNESFLNPAPVAGTQSATAYNMAADSSATAKVVAPLYKEKFGGKTSGLQVQNISGSPANVTVDFKVGSTTYTRLSQTVAAGASLNFYLMSDCGAACWAGGNALPAGSNASVTVTANQPILAAIAEQPWSAAAPNCFGQAGGPCYDRQNYEGFNVAP